MKLRALCQIISAMSNSEHLFVDALFEIFLDYIHRTGDVMETTFKTKESLTGALTTLVNRVATQPIARQLTVLGLIRARENGWKV
jgi:hypothetical protein